MIFVLCSPRLDLYLGGGYWCPISRKAVSLTSAGRRCCIEVARYGVVDRIECGGRSTAICASEDCCNFPCERHAKYCPTCGECYCESSDTALRTCFFAHVLEGACKAGILRAPLSRLDEALTSGRHSELYDFLRHDSDGLGNPLPREVCVNLGLAVVYSTDLLPDYNKDVLMEQDESTRARRARRQRLRRSARRLGVAAPVPRSSGPVRLAPRRNSTIHLVAGALLVRHSTGRWHYRQQSEMLGIMGLCKGQDFVRNRVAYLHSSNQSLFGNIQSWVRDLRNGNNSLEAE